MMQRDGAPVGGRLSSRRAGDRGRAGRLMKRSLIISSIAHAIVLGWGLVAFAARPNDAPPAEALPVEFISATELSQLTNGVKNAPKNAREAEAAGGQGRRAEAGQRARAESRGQARDQDRFRAAAADPNRSQNPSQSPRSNPSRSPRRRSRSRRSHSESRKSDQIVEELKKDEAKKPPKKPPEFKPDQIAEELKKDDTKKPRPPDQIRCQPSRGAARSARAAAAAGDGRDVERCGFAWGAERHTPSQSVAERIGRLAREFDPAAGLRRRRQLPPISSS